MNSVCPEDDDWLIEEDTASESILGTSWWSSGRACGSCCWDDGAETQLGTEPQVEAAHKLKWREQVEGSRARRRREFSFDDFDFLSLTKRRFGRRWCGVTPGRAHLLLSLFLDCWTSIKLASGRKLKLPHKLKWRNSWRGIEQEDEEEFSFDDFELPWVWRGRRALAEADTGCVRANTNVCRRSTITLGLKSAR